MPRQLKKQQNRVRIAKIFESLQAQMREQVGTASRVVRHPGSQGTARESSWVAMLGTYLPARYGVLNGHVIAHDGAMSEQIDLLVYDRQYSPFIFKQAEVSYIPAESVYAAFEVRPSLTPANLRYAGKKVASVRRLPRTSAPIPHAGGTFEPKIPIHILGGILCDRSSPTWHSATKVARALSGKAAGHRLDLGCVLSGRSFSATYSGDDALAEVSKSTTALVYFFIKVLARLQAVGTVAAIDWDEYAKQLQP
jgi:uncharacterized protein DUF6602